MNKWVGLSMSCLGSTILGFGILKPYVPFTLENIFLVAVSVLWLNTGIMVSTKDK
jgi:hypothetical protein